MPELASLVLRLAHLIYSLVLALLSIRARYFKPHPQPINAPRSKLPKHLGLVLACDQKRHHDADVQAAITQCVERAAYWCRAAGIARLTVYDRAGALVGSSEALRNLLRCDGGEDKVEKDFAYPLTPPLSDDSDSQPPSLEYPLDEDLHVKTMYLIDQEAESRRRGNRVRRRRGRSSLSRRPQERAFTVYVASRKSGKPTIASVANHFVRLASVKLSDMDDDEPFHMTTNDLQSVLEGEDGMPPPDLVVVHHITAPKYESPPLELHGFPPWQSRLTELYHDGYTGLRSHWLSPALDFLRPSCILFTEEGFRRALDEYSRAEFRLG
ncbi:hypothetical protein FA95DRAFT_1474106, partial [Auriscalpium vulgare]